MKFIKEFSYFQKLNIFIILTRKGGELCMTGLLTAKNVSISQCLTYI